MIDSSFLRKRKSKWTYPVTSILFHIAVVGGLFLLEVHLRKEMIREEIKKILEVRQVTNEELQKLLNRARVVETEFAEEKDLQPLSNQKAYSGERTQRVKQETRVKGAGSVKGTDLQATSKAGANIKLNEKGFGRKIGDKDKSKFQKGTYEILDPSIKVSSKTLLNTDAYVYATFANRMKESIAAAWTPRWRKVADKKKKEMAIGIYVTVTRIFIERDGTVKKVSIDRSAGIPELDKAAVDSILEVRSFPNPPPDLFGPTFNGNFDFTFMISLIPGSNFNFQFVQDERFDKLTR